MRNQPATIATRADMLLVTLRGYGVSRLVIDMDRQAKYQLIAAHNTRKHGSGPELVITAFHWEIEAALVEAIDAAAARGWKDGQL